MRRHWPTPAINWPPLIAGPSAPTAVLPGVVQGLGRAPAARLLVVVSGTIAVSNAVALNSFNPFILISVSMTHRSPWCTTGQSLPRMVVPQIVSRIREPAEVSPGGGSSGTPPYG